MERKDAIRSAYRMTGSNSFYDGMITCSTPGGKAVCRLVWDMDKAECDDYVEKALSGIPEGARGSNYADVAYDERFIILSGHTYTSRDEAEY